MTAKVKDSRRIACYGEKFVVIEKGEICYFIIIEEKKLKFHIDEIIEKEITRLEPYWIFRTAVEKITGHMFFGNRTAPKIEGRLMARRDQAIYKQWEDYILNNTKLKQRREQYLEGVKARKEYFEKNKDILEYEEKVFRRIATTRNR